MSFSKELRLAVEIKHISVVDAEKQFQEVKYIHEHTNKLT